MACADTRYWPSGLQYSLRTCVVPQHSSKGSETCVMKSMFKADEVWNWQTLASSPQSEVLHTLTVLSALWEARYFPGEGTVKLYFLTRLVTYLQGPRWHPSHILSGPDKRGKVILLTYMWHFEKETARESHIELLDDLIMYFTKRVGQYFTKSLVSTP